MLVVTGAAGFIGSCLVGKLNRLGFENILIVDDFSRKDKIGNLVDKRVQGLIHRDEFLNWLQDNSKKVQFVFHLGARTDTTEQDQAIFDQLNLNYSKQLWLICTEHNIPLLYASSAATYGQGELGYEDSHALVKDLKPLNPYGHSKNDFDNWLLQQDHAPSNWIGLKFFNVYGPNEYHKGRMASVIFHAFHQIKKTGKMKLFRSHRAGIADGQQSRDFIYVLDIVDICIFCLQHGQKSGIYNAGTGKARSFKDLVLATFAAMKLDPVIEFMDTPKDIRATYQYFTEAKMDKFKTGGYHQFFSSLEEGVHDYVTNYLAFSSYY